MNQDRGQRKPILKTVGLEMHYPMGSVSVHALRGVDIEVFDGEFVAVMGPSGCGKSTLLHIIGGMLTPTRGQVFVDGHELSAMTDAQRTELRRQKIGFVFQRFNLFPTLTVEGNLRLAERIYGDNGRDRVEHAARRAEILKLLGLDTKIHHKPTQLSGGEQQRVALARAVINRPAILLADEPTGNLDSDNSQIVLRLLKDLNRQFHQTIMMITHNPEAAAIADRTLHMRDGKIVG